MLHRNISGSCSSYCPSSSSLLAKVLPIPLEPSLNCCLWLFCYRQEFTLLVAELFEGLLVNLLRLWHSYNRNCKSSVSTMCFHPKFVTHNGHKVNFVHHPHHWWKYCLWHWLQNHKTLISQNLNLWAPIECICKWTHRLISFHIQQDRQI